MTIELDVFGLVVADMAKSLAFYRMLGLDIPAGADAEPHVEVRVRGVRLTFDTVAEIKSFDPDWTAPSFGTGASLAFHCGDPAGVDATHARLVAAGHHSHKVPWDAFWGQRYAQLRDPDGTPIDLFAPRAA